MLSTEWLRNPWKITHTQLSYHIAQTFTQTFTLKSFEQIVAAVMSTHVLYIDGQISTTTTATRTESDLSVVTVIQLFRCCVDIKHAFLSHFVFMMTASISSRWTLAKYYGNRYTKWFLYDPHWCFPGIFRLNWSCGNYCTTRHQSNPQHSCNYYKRHYLCLLY